MTSQWAWWRLRSPASRLFTQPFIQTQIKKNIKAPRHWPLCGEFTGTGEFPAQRASYEEYVSIWWRHHATLLRHTVAFIVLPRDHSIGMSPLWPLLDATHWVIYDLITKSILIIGSDKPLIQLHSLIALQWCHNGCNSVLNHQLHDCLLNGLFRRRSKKTWKLRVTGLCAGNLPGTGEFPAQMASNAENGPIWWRHHGFLSIGHHGRISLTQINFNPSMDK